MRLIVDIEVAERPIDVLQRVAQSMPIMFKPEHFVGKKIPVRAESTGILEGTGRVLGYWTVQE
jgi:hypothetical protein